MRILYAIMAYGPQIIASEVHSELGRYYRQNGHTFEVLSLEDYSEAGAAGATPFPDEASEVEVHTLKFKKNSLLRRILRKVCQKLFHYGFFLELYWGYVSFLRKHRRDYDIIHVEAAYPLGAAAALAARRVKIPFVVNLQGADVMRLPEYDYGYGRYPLPRWLLRYTFKKAAAVRANSEVTEEIARSYGAKRTQVIIRNISENIYPAPDLNLAENKRQQQQILRERYGLNPGPILIAYSRLHPFKGLDWLVKAMPELRKQIGDINLLICGPGRSTPKFGDYRKYLENLADKVGAREDIIFTGKIDFAYSQNYLAGADVLIVPSIIEALNKVVIEAAAVGTPSVSTDTTGVAIHAERAGIGLSVKPSSSEALVTGIVQVLAQREAMGQNGPQFAAAFTSQSIGEQLLQFYQKAIKGWHTKYPATCYIAYPSSLVLKSANAIQTYTTCRELKKLNPSTLVLIPRLPGKPSRFADPEVKARHLLRLPFNYFNNFGPLKIIPWSYVERAWFTLLVGFWLLGRRITGRGCKIIYSRDVIVTYFLLRYWRGLLNTKIVYEAHDLEQRNPSRAQNLRLRKWLEKVDRVILDKADGVVSLTEAFLDYMSDEGFRNRTLPATVIADAFDASVYRQTSQSECRAALGLPQEAFIIVYSGLTFAYRNLDKLAEAFAAFLQDNSTNPPAAWLYLVGGRPFEQKEMQQVAEKLGLSERIKCVGQMPPDKVNLYLNAASLLAIPDTVTDITASPLKMFEYAAVGRPVLLPHLPALKEILREDEAIYFTRGDVKAMQAAITQAYTQPEDAANRGEAGRQRVAAFTYENRARAILDFVSQVTGVRR